MPRKKCHAVLWDPVDEHTLASAKNNRLVPLQAKNEASHAGKLIFGIRHVLIFFGGSIDRRSLGATAEQGGPVAAPAPGGGCPRPRQGEGRRRSES